MPTLWDAASGEVIPLPAKYILVDPYFDNDGRLIAWDSSNEELVFYDIASRTVISSFPSEHGHYVNEDSPPDMERLRPQGRYLILGNQGDVKLWSLDSEQVLWSSDDWLRTGRFSPDDKYFVYYLDNSSNIAILNLEENRFIASVLFQPSGTIEFPSNEIACASTEYQHVCFLLATGEEVPAPVPAPPKAAYQANGIHFFREYDAVSHYGNALRLELDDGQVLHTLRMNPQFYGSYLSSDAKRLFIQYIGQTIGIWAVPN